MTEVAVPAVPRYLAQETPWRKADSLLSSAVTLVGLVGVGIAWVGVSGEADFDNQQSWLMVAIGAGVILGLGMSWWLLVGFREVRRAQREFVADLRLTRKLLPTTGEPALSRAARPAAVAPAHSDDLVTGERMTLVHRSTCPMVAGKPIVNLDRAQAAARRLDECKVCLQ
ncbi:hypothetical protein [Sporichthya sp.]|uniref:hypothetical protein n=1 Tax=Sporichthya sp. TaxID=65475 RepID=UPI00181A2E39|nr:hypothetical protein [Sporichthya sp.]MBA3741634.1 hypothetical protein [Sporichthya sp.]